jgi:ubiquinone/menaquinone biosynthesis C-methylase UbiE
LAQWQLVESSADAYERYLVPLLFAPGAQYLMQLAGLETGERVLDVACGTGIVARTAAPHVGAAGTVTGIDLNEGMLAVARKESATIHPPIQWRQGDACSIPFPDDAFDVAFCQQGLQFIPDPGAALREVERVLAPKGRLVLSMLRSIEYNPGYAALAEVFEPHIGPEAAMMMRSPFSPMSSGELRSLFVEAGFQNVQLLIGIGPVRYPSAAEMVQWEIASSPIAAGPQLAALKEGDGAARLIRDLEKALAEYTDDHGIVFPTETYLVAARR